MKKDGINARVRFPHQNQPSGGERVCRLYHHNNTIAKQVKIHHGSQALPKVLLVPFPEGKVRL